MKAYVAKISISCYWLIDSAMYVLIKMYSPVVAA